MFCSGSFWRFVSSSSSPVSISDVPAGAQAARGLRRPASLVTLIVFAIAAVVATMRLRQPPNVVGPTQAHAPTLLQVQQLAELATARVSIVDVRETKLAGYLGDVRAVLLVRGEALLGPDLSEASVLSDEQQRRLTITLPRPHLISCRLDHAGTRLLSLSHDGLWAIVPGDAGRTAVLNRAYQEAEKAVAAAGATPATLEQAKIQAQSVLGNFFAAAGWSVKVRWTN
jgi:hypothetical protein